MSLQSVLAFVRNRDMDIVVGHGFNDATLVPAHCRGWMLMDEVASLIDLILQIFAMNSKCSRPSAIIPATFSGSIFLNFTC